MSERVSSIELMFFSERRVGLDGSATSSGDCKLERLRAELRLRIDNEPTDPYTTTVANGSVSPAVSPAGILSAADALAERLAGLDCDRLDADALSDLIVELDRSLSRVTACHREVLGAWDVRGAWGLDGSRSGAGWLAARCDTSRSSATGSLKTAATLRKHPATADAAREGCLGTDKIRLLAMAARRLPEPYSRDETMILTEAVNLSVRQLARFLAHWQLYADPDGADDRASRNHERRALHISEQFDGTWKLDGTLEAEIGEIIANAINHRAEQLFRNEKLSGDLLGEFSTPAQRRSDALAELIMQALSTDPTTSTAATPLLVAFVDAHKLAETNPTGPVGETAGGYPIDAATARRLACDAGIARIITNGTPTPVDLGLTHHDPSPSQRRALTARDRGCTFPGCDRPPALCHAHHIHHWAKQGPTNMVNLTLLCNRHHHLVHEGGFTLTRTTTGHLRFTRPTGQPITVNTHNPPTTPTW